MSPQSTADMTAAELLQLVSLVSALPNFYPWAILQPDGKSFDQMAVIGTPAVGDGEVIVNTLVVPDGYDGIIRRISNNFLGASFNPGLPSLTWRIRIGSAIAGSRFANNYNAINVEFGTTEHPREIDGILVTTGQTVLYTVTNNDPGLPISPSTQIACCFSGAFWPEQRDAKK